MKTTINQLLMNGTKKLKQASMNTARLDAEVILAHQLGCNRIDLIINCNDEVDEKQQKLYYDKIKERIQGKPVQYIVGQQEFMGLPFKVTPDVLIPRPDTEILVESAIEEAKSMKKPLIILDIGTGSGAIALSLAHYIMESLVYTVDISPEAIEVAQENAKHLSLTQRVYFYLGDLMTPLEKELYGKVDLLVSNPPYIPHHEIANLQKEVRDYEPTIALDGGKDGLEFYRRILKEGEKLLSFQGKMIFEVGYDQAQSVFDILKESKIFNEIAIQKDLAGIDRTIIARK
ncbi:peptide chain release factor N(5)-glutamine methyltransferase [Garciella nitratireducens]|uniref:peptide chain release factor N(5)-glutamine methyltransferase n=1 Tax=Garciella nitratireducens TaxID=218205 RepID=UPI000DE93949|nr:peptide chain release factor N(5)-glutamine methyltransferase [Garciella nitratireducens]RBP37052.1 release factor glutamine methyltransferase [Garciella nitratireducens]